MSSQHVVALLVSDPQDEKALREGLMRSGLQVVELQTTDALHRELNHQRVDALIIEQDLPGFLTGLDVVERLRQQLLRPACVLVGHLSPADRARAETVQVDHLTDWDAGIESICRAIQALLTRPDGTVTIPFVVRQLVQNSDFIRPLPQIVVRLSYYLSDDRASTAELAKDISTDSRITADLLRMVNSASFGMRNQIVRVADAVAALGIRRTACLIMATAIQEVQAGFDRRLSEDLLQWYRTRSLLTASSTSAFAKLFGVSKDHAYTLGLLQDLGILILAHHFGQRYLHLIERLRSIALIHLDACERQEFSFTHAEVSAALLLKWGLPASIVRLVRDHHGSAAGAALAQLDAQFLQLMRLGEAVADMSDVPSVQRNARLQQLLRGLGTADAGNIRNCLVAAISTANEMSQLFNIPVPEGARWSDLVDRIRQELQLPESESPDGDGSVNACLHTGLSQNVAARC